jgi:hypothetical protein
MKTDYDAPDTTWLTDQATAALDAIEALHNTAMADLRDATEPNWPQSQRAEVGQ